MKPDIGERGLSGMLKTNSLFGQTVITSTDRLTQFIFFIKLVEYANFFLKEKKKKMIVYPTNTKIKLL